jgi:hypothetical protein
MKYLYQVHCPCLRTYGTRTICTIPYACLLGWFAVVNAEKCVGGWKMGKHRKIYYDFLLHFNSLFILMRIVRTLGKNSKNLSELLLSCFGKHDSSNSLKFFIFYINVLPSFFKICCILYLYLYLSSIAYFLILPFFVCVVMYMCSGWRQF